MTIGMITGMVSGGVGSITSDVITALKVADLRKEFVAGPIEARISDKLSYGIESSTVGIPAIGISSDDKTR